MPVEDRTNELDLDTPDRVQIGVSRGESANEIGRPRDFPDRASVAIGPADGGGVLFSIDAKAGDHAMGHADVELSVDETRRLRDELDDLVRWMVDDGDETVSGDER